MRRGRRQTGSTGREHARIGVIRAALSRATTPNWVTESEAISVTGREAYWVVRC
jgi:nucleoside diphosphate kinase